MAEGKLPVLSDCVKKSIARVAVPFIFDTMICWLLALYTSSASSVVLEKLTPPTAHRCLPNRSASCKTLLTLTEVTVVLLNSFQSLRSAPAYSLPHPQTWPLEPLGRQLGLLHPLPLLFGILPIGLDCRLCLPNSFQLLVTLFP